MDLPSQLKVAFEKPRDPIGIFNYEQQEKRALCAFACALVLGAGGWVWRRDFGLLLGLIAGFALGELVGSQIFKARPYPPDIWRDYRMQSASWANSLLVHAIALTLLLLPYISGHVAAGESRPQARGHGYLALPPAHLAGHQESGRRWRRWRSLAHSGVERRDSQICQGAACAAHGGNPQPQAQACSCAHTAGAAGIEASADEFQLTWGDPNGVAGPASNGPGFGGGIGSGSGGGIGSGNGGGLGPGEGGGVGGGVYSVGGGVSAPIPIYKPEPAYSEEARKAKYQGTVVLFIVVDASGAVTECRVIKPLGLGLDEKAVETVKTWKFKPALKNGTPVPVQVTVEVSFRLF